MKFVLMSLLIVVEIRVEQISLAMLIILSWSIEDFVKLFALFSEFVLAGLASIIRFILSLSASLEKYSFLEIS